MIHHPLTTNKDQHYGVNINHDKTRVLLQLGDAIEQVRVQLTPEEVDCIIANLQLRKAEIRKAATSDYTIEGVVEC
jgi:hypothetical protein